MSRYKIIKLRSHHMMCLQNFKGQGYTQNFIDNMYDIKKYMDENPNVKIKFIKESDALCSKCPHNTDNKCECCEKTDLYDKRIMDICGLSYNKEYSAQYINKKVKDYIIDKKLISVICNGCKWIKYCI